MAISAISNSTSYSTTLSRLQSQATSTTSKAAEEQAEKAAGTDSAAEDKAEAAKAAAPARGARPAGGPPPARPASSTSAAATSQNKTYAKADANQDGSVSYMESVLYSLNNNASETQSASTTTAQKQSALKAYQNTQQAATGSVTTNLTTI